MPNEKYTLNYTAVEVDNAVGKALSIEANPTLAGTEDSLNGLQVGDTKYKVDSGISQTDADARYLKLAGGTMTGPIKVTNNDVLKSGNVPIISLGSFNGSVVIGDFDRNGNILLRTKNVAQITHQTNNGNATVLDGFNTQANPTLAGTETALTSLKLNGTNYAIAGGTQVTFVDWS